MTQHANLARSWFCWALLVAAVGCGEPAGSESVVAKRQFEPFQREVYPVLLRDCGFPACHGDPQRFFRVWGPGRARLPTKAGVTPEAFDLPTGDEVSTSYSMAESMIDDKHPEKSLLLRKPLAIEAGGVSHHGADKYGRDVYRTSTDTGYVTLARWVLSMSTAAPATTPGATP